MKGMRRCMRQCDHWCRKIQLQDCFSCWQNCVEIEKKLWQLLQLFLYGLKLCKFQRFTGIYYRIIWIFETCSDLQKIR